MFAILYPQPKIVNKFKTLDYSEGTTEPPTTLGLDIVETEGLRSRPKPAAEGRTKIGDVVIAD